MKEDALVFCTQNLGYGIKSSSEQAINYIKLFPKAYDAFCGFDEKYKLQILEFLQGKRSLKITYDNFFMYIFNPHIHPERLEKLLSALMGEKVKIKQILPREGVQLSENGSLVIMDIIAELESGALVDVEMQKIGYKFPGERSSCYVSDMIMRQYNRLKSRKTDKFSYKELKPVYLIILMEESSGDFKLENEAYIHRRTTEYSSGVAIPDLANITYISLDTFRSVVHNVNTELEAWLTFLSCEEMDKIDELIRKYPFFAEYYEDIMEFRNNPEELIFMFSEALAIMDRNTALYMIDEQREEIEQLKRQLSEERAKLGAELATKDSELATKDAEIAKLKALINQ